MMKILLIMPDARMHKLKMGSRIRSFREAPLTLITLAALAPDEDIEYLIVDESVDRIPYNYRADLVGISIITGTANRGYKIARSFRDRGVPVVLGGVHATIRPQEAAENADTIVTGMAEKSWPKLISDFKRNRLRPRYDDKDIRDDTIINVPPPRIDLLRRSGYMVPDTVHATRGCSHNCDFCSVTAVWPKYYQRPVADVITDIKKLPGKRIVFNDVSLFDDREYAKELFSALIPLKKKWGGLATTTVANDAETLDIMKKSGCIYLLLGFESVNQATLNGIAKGFNQKDAYKETMQRLHDCHISVQGCFVFGFDEDDRDVFKKTVAMVQELKIDIPRYSIYTPYPGTRLFARLEKEGRILSYNWDNYDTMHVVHEPKRLTPAELYTGFKWAYKETFRLPHIAKRTIFQFRSGTLVNFIGNLAYRVFVKRLYTEDRFREPFMSKGAVV